MLEVVETKSFHSTTPPLHHSSAPREWQACSFRLQATRGGKLFLTVFYCPNQGGLVRNVRLPIRRAICSLFFRPPGLQFTAHILETSQTASAKPLPMVALRFFSTPRMRDIRLSHLTFPENGALACAPAPLSNCGHRARHPPLRAADPRKRRSRLRAAASAAARA